MNEGMKIEDGSNDKKYFTIIPNYIGNHSTANDQALYFQIKKHCGENGECYVSKRTLMKKLGIGHKTLMRSFAYLTENGWIEKIGTKKALTEGGPQTVDVYKTADIWELNFDHYESQKRVKKPVDNSGSRVMLDENTLAKGVAESFKGVAESNSRCSQVGTKEYPIINKNQYNKREAKKESRHFVPPTLSQVSEYCKERGNRINPQTFIDFYSAKGWIIGRTRMKDWRAAVRTWEGREAEKEDESVDAVGKRWLAKKLKEKELANG